MKKFPTKKKEKNSLSFDKSMSRKYIEPGFYRDIEKHCKQEKKEYLDLAEDDRIDSEIKKMCLNFRKKADEETSKLLADFEKIRNNPYDGDFYSQMAGYDACFSECY